MQPETPIAAYRAAADLYGTLAGTGRQQGTCLYRLGGALAELGRYEEASSTYAAAVGLHPGLREEVGVDDDTLHRAWSTRSLAEDRGLP